MVRLGLKVRGELKDGLPYCKKAIGEDIESVIEWAHIFADPQEMTDTLAKNVSIHALGIANSIRRAKRDWEAQEYYKSGQDFAFVFTLAFGWPQPSDEQNFVSESSFLQ